MEVILIKILVLAAIFAAIYLAARYWLPGIIKFPPAAAIDEISAALKIGGF